MKQAVLLGTVSVALATRCFSQTAPPNDDFANRTVLTGNSVAFSGTLAGATLEPQEDLGGNFTNYFDAIQSVWWTWTAPQTSLVIVEMTGASADTAPGGGVVADGLVIYDTTNVFTQAPPIAELGLDVSILCDALTFRAVEGSTYQIQMIGSTSTSYQFLLVATNTPLVLQAPRNLAVSSNASTLFTVVAEGYRPLGYQWQFNGTTLAGQTAPMLALTNIDGSQAGNYSVIISNTGGAVTSSPAALAVSSSNVPPLLVGIGTQAGQFGIVLTGEIGRNYRIESSVDLIEWTNDYEFYANQHIGFDYGRPSFTSVVFNTNASSTFAISNGAPYKFLRASQYRPANEICINNLRQIRFAKSLWQRDTASPRWSTPGLNHDLAPYFLQSNLPYCPFDTNASWVTSYSTGVNNCATTPTCVAVPLTHILEEPQ